MKNGKLGRRVRVILSVLLYICLLFGCQSCVMSGYMSKVMLDEGFTPTTEQDILLSQAEYLIERVNAEMVMILLIANLLTVLIVCALFHLRRRSPRVEMSVYGVNFLRYPTFAVYGVALNVCISIVLSYLPLPESILSAFDAQYDALYGGNIALEIVSVAVVAGIVEELVFRGIAITRLSQVYTPGVAVVLSAALFGLAHGTPIAIGYAMLLGLLFGALFRRYSSVVPGIICHVFFNMTSYWLAPLTEAYPILIPILFGASLALIAWCSYRIFVRCPTFHDLLADIHGRILPQSEEEAAVIRDLKQMEIPHAFGEIDQDFLTNLEARWTQCMRDRRKRK